MEINWIIVGIVAICVVILIVFLIRKNQKDKKKYTHFLNNDYKKANEEESDLNDDTY
jgi:beta-lactam-binding protein with PASTA domain